MIRLVVLILISAISIASATMDQPEIHLRDQRQAGRANGEGAEGGRPPPSEQLNRQQPQPTFEEEIARQEQAARNQEKAVTGLEIAQGAIEITLGAVRIAANGATADFIHREDAIARSRASASSLAIGREAQGRAPEGRQKDAAEEAARRAVCAQVLRRTQLLADDPYSTWNSGYLGRMKRSVSFGHLIGNQSYSVPKPTPDPHGVSYPLKPPTLDEADQLLNLLEKLLNTNNEVLRVLGIDLPPLSSQPSNPGAMILHQYRERLKMQREMEHQYGETGYLDEGFAVSNLLEQGAKWKSTLGRPADVHALSSELAQLNRVRQRLNVG